jgi:hypothetical protein
MAFPLFPPLFPHHHRQVRETQKKYQLVKKKGAAQPVYYRSPSPRFLLAHGILFFFFLFLTMYVSSGPIASQSVLAYTVSLSFFIGGTIAKIYGEAPVSLLVFPFIRYLFPSRCSSAIRDKENSQTS